MHSHHNVVEADPRASFFDERAKHWEERCYPEETRLRLQELIPSFALASGMNTLDLGCGSGVLGPYLRPLVGPEAELHAVDVSAEMIRMAEVKKVYTRCIHASAMSLPLPDASLDAVVCFAAFPHFSDKAAALSEIYRVLKPGGLLSIAHLLSREELSRHHGGTSAVSGDCLPDDDAMRELMIASGFSMPSITDEPGRYLAQARKE